MEGKTLAGVNSLVILQRFSISELQPAWTAFERQFVPVGHLVSEQSLRGYETSVAFVARVWMRIVVNQLMTLKSFLGGQSLVTDVARMSDVCGLLNVSLSVCSQVV